VSCLPESMLLLLLLPPLLMLRSWVSTCIS
jgi:hypothetical protein